MTQLGPIHGPHERCAHRFDRMRRFPVDCWPMKYRWHCVKCGMVTRSYDGADRMALRPVHEHMSVAVEGFNTVEAER